MSSKSRNTSRRTGSTSSPGPNPVIIGGAVLAVLVLVVLAVIFIAGDDGGDGSGDVPVELEEYGAVSVEGQALPPLGDGADAAVGAQAPGVISEQPAGTVRLEPGDGGQPILAVFVAHWCPHCQREVPLLVDLAEEGAFEGVRVVAVATSSTPTRPNFPPSAWLEDEQWPGEILYDDQQSTAASAYGLTAFPMMVFIDADGTVVSRITGEQPAEAIEAEVAKITTG